ncbi:MAG TPA: YihY/virulence factor BrkB family protein [Noviherbaspirillum sp.]|nr:YihY/virulence factor BrkB family protein [Noviherbaspirillum sp.]
MHILGLHGISLFTVIKKSVADFFDDDMTTFASALAYQALFSIFPFIIFLIALLAFLDMASFFEWLRQQASLLFPEQAMQQINQVIDDLQQQKAGLMSFGVVVALWTASAAVRATMHALNVAYDVNEERPAWKLYPLSIFYTVGLAAMLIFAAVLLMIGPQAMQWLAQQIGMEQLFVTLWAWLRLPAALLVMMLAVALIYYAAPNVEQQFRFITPGSVLAVLVWVIASIGFNYYVRSFADYSATYGSIGAIVVLLLYFFLSAAVLLFGAEINASIEHLSSEGKKPGEKTIH